MEDSVLKKTQADEIMRANGLTRIPNSQQTIDYLLNGNETGRPHDGQHPRRHPHQ